MNSAEAPVSQIEAIPNEVKFAARHVSVVDYLKLRSKRLRKSDMEGENEREWAQIVDAATPVYKFALEHGSLYNPHDKVERSFHPFVIISRAILARVPLPQYLLARQEVLQKGLTRNVDLRNHFEESVGYDSQLEKSTLEVMSLYQELDLTNAVATAANNSVYK